MRDFIEGDWAAYNWLDDDGNDNWKVGRIVKVPTLERVASNVLSKDLMYFNDDGTERSGYIPLTSGVKLLTNEEIDDTIDIYK